MSPAPPKVPDVVIYKSPLPTDAPTPEVAAYQAQRDVSEASHKQIWRRVVAALGLALLISVGTNIYNTIVAHEIRTTQVANTKVAQCQDQSFRAILKDARLAFSGDTNAKDYVKAPRSC